jgi:hypothetical protein
VFSGSYLKMLIAEAIYIAGNIMRMIAGYSGLFLYNVSFKRKLLYIRKR